MAMKPTPFSQDIGDITPHMYVGNVAVDNTAANAIKGATGLFEQALGVRDQFLIEDFKNNLGQMEEDSLAGQQEYRKQQLIANSPDKDADTINRAAEKMRKIELGLEQGVISPAQAKMRRNALLKDSINQYPWLSSDFRSLASGYTGSPSTKGQGDFDLLTNAQDKKTQAIAEIQTAYDLDYASAAKHYRTLQQNNLRLEQGISYKEETGDYTSTVAQSILQKSLGDLRTLAKAGNVTDYEAQALTLVQSAYNNLDVALNQTRLALKQQGISYSDDEWNKYRSNARESLNLLENIASSKDPNKQLERLLNADKMAAEYSILQNARGLYNLKLLGISFDSFYTAMNGLENLRKTFGDQNLDKLAQTNPYIASMMTMTKEGQAAILNTEVTRYINTGQQSSDPLVKEIVDNAVAGSVHNEINDRTYTEDEQKFNRLSERYPMPRMLTREGFMAWSQLPEKAKSMIESSEYGAVNSAINGMMQSDLYGQYQDYAALQERLSKEPAGPSEGMANVMEKRKKELSYLGVMWNSEEGFLVPGGFVQRSPISLLQKGQSPLKPLDSLNIQWLLRKKYGLFKTPADEEQWAMNKINEINSKMPKAGGAAGTMPAPSTSTTPAQEPQDGVIGGDVPMKLEKGVYVINGEIVEIAE